MKKKIFHIFIITLFFPPSFSQIEIKRLPNNHHQPISFSFITPDTGYVLTENELDDSIHVYITTDGCDTFNDVIKFAGYQYQIKIFSSKDWGIIIGNQSNEGYDFYGKQFIIIFKEQGKKWEFLDLRSYGVISEVCFPTHEIAYFLSVPDTNKQSIGKIWNKGDSIQNIVTFEGHVSSIHSFKLFESGIGYFMRNSSLYKTVDYCKSSVLISENIYDYSFINPLDGAIIKHSDYQLFFTHDGGVTFSLPFDLRPEIEFKTSKIIMMNTHSISYVISVWIGHSGGVHLVSIDESGIQKTTAIFKYWGGMDFVSWDCQSPDSTVCYCNENYIGIYGILKTNSINQLLFKNDIENQSFSNNINIYPNPVNTQLNISIKSNNSCKLRIRLIDIQGIIIEAFTKSVKPGINTFSIDTKRLTNGHYILEIENCTLVDQKLFH